VELDQYSEVADAEILVSVTGTAEEGVDFLDIDNLLIIPAGDSVGTIEIETLADDLEEVNESIIVSTFICNDIISSDTFWLADPQLITVDIPEDSTICANSTDPVVLTATPNGGYEPYLFSWFYDGTLEGVGAQFGVPPYATGEHICVITGDCGYQYNDTFTLNHFPPVPEATFESDFGLEADQIVEGCEYTKLSFTLPFAYDVDTILPFQIVGGDAEEGVDFYALPRSITVPAGELSASINIEAIVDGVFEDDETIQFYFPFYDECTDYPNPITATILSNPEISSHLDDTMLVCEGHSFELDAQIIGGIEPYVFNWTQKPAGVWTTETIEQIAEDTTMYYLSVRDACEYEVLDSIVVVVPHYPELKISSVYSSEISMCREDLLNLKPTISGGTGLYTLEWQIDGLPFSNDAEISIQSDELALNNYTLSAIDSCGNVAERTFQVKIEHCEVPNVFTPNGDGLNDEFYFNSKDVEGNIRVKIHDRWGKSVFESNHYELCNDKGIKCWDGTDNDGKDYPEGVYFYVIEYFDGRLLKGSFNLLR
ncbi:MAG: gliding motility-associated C-terminal domain-containing protein, partial [Flavobacteriales bacterium]